ncbi:N-acetylmannosamine kinase [Haemophilus paracuniculus]|uniref:N-acetylmannosamine kinase n=1 Tax=Haemophilus paracuniculus TaxID=734 RepID=A0A1T0ASF2_9PAST|nr:MurR/RpiR family transcriptional regulator [Haemophilus paracuniculus]OOR99317.1 N-acetylmannosamine kinase [Haemophilus paracuniculus]
MSARGKILDTIGALKNSLTKTEKKIATAILLQPEMISQCSLAEVAKQFDVGEATFIRFCRTVGYKGFTDFKLDLAIEIATHAKVNGSLLDGRILDSDQPQEIAVKLQQSLGNVIAETVNLLNFDTLEQVVTEIRQAKRIFLFGMGASGLTAEDAKHKLMRIGLHTDSSNNNHFMYMQAALVEQGDIVIGISHSGSSEETVKALRIARFNGAKTVALTHNLRSPITEVADYVLINGNRQGYMQGDSITTKMAQLFVLDLIYTLLVKAEPERAKQQKQKTLNAIAESRVE